MNTFKSIIPILLTLAGPALRAQVPADGPLDITARLVDDLLAEANGRNPTLLAAGARAEAANAAVDAVRTWQDPVVRLGVWGSTPRGMPASQEGNIVYGIEEKLPLFGHPQVARHLAEADAARERLSVGDAQEGLRRDLTLALLDIALTDRAAGLAAQNLDWAETALASVDARYRAGRSGQAEWLAAETERAEAAEELTTVRAGRASQEEQADRLLNRSGPSRWPEISLPAVAGPVSYDERIVAAAMAFAPRLKVMRQEALRNEAAAHLTWHMRMPEVGLGLEARQYAGDAGFREGMMTVNVSLPWVNARRYDSDVARDKALARAAQRDADAYTNEVREGVHRACVDLDAARRRAVLYRDRLIPLAEQALAGAKASWEGGQARFQDILEAHHALVADRLALAEAAVGQRREMAELTLLTGEADPASAFAPVPSPGRP
jgi:outer membrane protein TolC